MTSVSSPRRRKRMGRTGIWRPTPIKSKVYGTYCNDDLGNRIYPPVFVPIGQGGCPNGGSRGWGTTTA